MATVNWANGTSLANIEDSWKSTVTSIFNAVPTTWNGMSVSLQVNYTRNGSHSKTSKHYVGLAIDLNIILAGKLIRTGNVGSALPSDSVKVNGSIYQIKDIYSDLIGNAAKANNSRWGGDFGGGVYPKYDPMHIDGGKSFYKGKGTVSDDGDSFFIYSQMPPLDAGTTYTETAGTSSKLDTGSAVVQTKNTILYIGYDLTLSDFASTPLGTQPLKTILLEASVPEVTANKLVELSGLTGDAAYSKYNSYSDLTITTDNADLILKSQVTALVKYLKDSKGFDSSEYPKEISTAIASYFFGKNLSAPENITQFDEMFKIIKSSSQPAVELARYIETKSVGLSADIKGRRDSEVQLLRNYNPNASTTTAQALTSTEASSKYESNSELLKAQLDNQINEMKNLFTSRKSLTTDPASSEYDDTFNDIDQSTLDSIASIMQAQQVNSDLYFGYKDSEYLYRLKTKNFYSILSRNLNTKISNIEKMVESDDVFKDHKEYNLSTMYSMVPYSTGMSYTIKKNAVSRCEYRIRLLELRIKNNESSLISFGVPSTDSYLECGAFIATLPLRLTAQAAAILVNTIMEFFTTLGVLREQLKLERGNLAKLKKDMNRYSG